MRRDRGIVKNFPPGDEMTRTKDPERAADTPSITLGTCFDLYPGAHAVQLPRAHRTPRPNDPLSHGHRRTSPPPRALADVRQSALGLHFCAGGPGGMC